MESFLPAGIKSNDVYLLISMLITLSFVAAFFRDMTHHNKFAARVKALQERRAQLKSNLTAPRKRQKESAAKRNIGFIRAIVNKMNLLQKMQLGKINHMLVNAGYRSKDAIFIYAFVQLIAPVILLAVALAAVKIDFSDIMQQKWKLFTVIAAAYLGIKLPSIIVMNVRQKRYAAIQRGMPDTLDLMMICAEAGLSLAASLDRVARELQKTYPEVSEELSITSIETGFLPDRKKALSNLAERVDMPEVRGISSVLIQTEKYGTPVAQALRVLATELREQRMLRAEQKAARLPALMTIPMMVFIFPTIFIVILTPAVIHVMDSFK